MIIVYGIVGVFAVVGVICTVKAYIKGQENYKNEICGAIRGLK